MFLAVWSWKKIGAVTVFKFGPRLSGLMNGPRLSCLMKIDGAGASCCSSGSSWNPQLLHRSCPGLGWDQLGCSSVVIAQK